MHLPKACLFDLDGVLLNTEHLHGQAWKEAASEFNINLTDQQLMLLRGRRRIDCINQIIHWSKRRVITEDFLKVHQPISRKLLLNASPMPGAKSLIEHCVSAEIPIALVTSSSSSSLDLKTASHLWIKNIKTKVLGDDLELNKGKPAPDPFLLAAKKLQVSPKECWALEDSESGSQSALAAGCQVWILTDNQNGSIFPDKKLDIDSNPKYINKIDYFYKALNKEDSLKL